MKKLGLVLLGSVLVVLFFGACAHEEDKAKDLASDHFEVSAQGGDDKIVRSNVVGGVVVEVGSISGKLKVKGVNQKYMSGLVVHLVDRDATIFARARTNSAGGFQLVGQIPHGFYLIKVIDRRFMGQLSVQYNGSQIRDLTVPVRPVIR